MADRPGSFRGRQGVSRHTMVMRRAKDEDARRLAESEDAIPAPLPGENPSASSRLTARGSNTRRIERQTSERTTSGRRVVVKHEGGISARYRATEILGDRATSVRVAGGDTIIRYKSGDMVIKRGSRRAELRRQILIMYALGYFILFGCYGYTLVAGTTTIDPDAFIAKAFAMRQSDDVMDLERAALEAMRGNRTPAEIRLAQQVSFYDEEKNTIRVEKGARLTLLTAAKLGHAILEDRDKPAAQRTFNAPFKIYKETYLVSVNWPYWLTFYNALGFFLLLGLFLWRPLMHWLGTQGKKTAVALRSSRDAQDLAADYRNQYRALANEIETKGDEMRADAQARAAKEKEEALEAARKQAEEIAGGIEGALKRESVELAGSIGRQAAIAACDQARRILEERLGPKEHDAAIDDLIADIAGMNFRDAAGK